MNCAICSAYLALKHDVRAKGVKMIRCLGCRPRNKNCAWLKKQCPQLASDEISFCYECNTFPCKRLIAIDERYRTHFRMSMIDNLKFVKEHGMEKFLKQQEKVWKCKRCGEMVCCHNGLCFNCDLERIRSKKQKYRWEEK
jgi:hypothetical protein